MCPRLASETSRGSFDNTSRSQAEQKSVLCLATLQAFSTKHPEASGTSKNTVRASVDCDDDEGADAIARGVNIMLRPCGCAVKVATSRFTGQVLQGGMATGELCTNVVTTDLILRLHMSFQATF